MRKNNSHLTVNHSFSEKKRSISTVVKINHLRILTLITLEFKVCKVPASMLIFRVESATISESGAPPTKVQRKKNGYQMAC